MQQQLMKMTPITFLFEEPTVRGANLGDAGHGHGRPHCKLLHCYDQNRSGVSQQSPITVLHSVKDSDTRPINTQCMPIHTTA